LPYTHAYTRGNSWRTRSSIALQVRDTCRHGDTDLDTCDDGHTHADAHAGFRACGHCDTHAQPHTGFRVSGYPHTHLNSDASFYTCRHIYALRCADAGFNLRGDNRDNHAYGPPVLAGFLATTSRFTRRGARAR
jgi:hypothetical protein